MLLLKEQDFTLGPKEEEALQEKKKKNKANQPKTPQKNHNKTHLQQKHKKLATKAWYSCDKLHSSVISGVWL